jgi:hypothetical protein
MTRPSRGMLLVITPRSGVTPCGIDADRPRYMTANRLCWLKRCQSCLGIDADAVAAGNNERRNQAAAEAAPPDLPLRGVDPGCAQLHPHLAWAGLRHRLMADAQHGGVVGRGGRRERCNTRESGGGLVAPAG